MVFDPPTPPPNDDAVDATWYRLELGTGSNFGLARTTILNTLADLTMQAVRRGADCRSLVALGTEERSSDRAVYLSPGWRPSADALIGRYQGRRCDRPDRRREDLHLLAGTADAARRQLGGELAESSQAAGRTRARGAPGSAARTER